MPFPNYDPEIEIVVTHKWYPEQEFVFTFPKSLPDAALDAEKAFLGLTDLERPEKARTMLIELVSKMASKPPRGFPGFPADEQIKELPAAIKEYFDEPAQPELEAIISSAWTGYRAAARPAAYAKSVSRNGARAGQSSGAAPQT